MGTYIYMALLCLTDKMAIFFFTYTAHFHIFIQIVIASQS